MESPKFNAEAPEPTQTLEDIDALEAQDFYTRLGVSLEASQDEIKQAFRSLSSKFHPDRVNSDGTMRENYEEIQKRLSEAFNTLKDPSAKSRYDAKHAYRNPTRNESEQPRPPEKKEASLTPEQKLKQYTSELSKAFDDIQHGRNHREFSSIESGIIYTQAEYAKLGISSEQFVRSIKNPLLSHFSYYLMIDSRSHIVTQMTYAMARLGISPEEIDQVRKYASVGHRWRNI